MSKPVTLDPEALEELEAAAVFYDSRRPGLGDDLLAEADVAISQLQQQPALFSLAPGISRELCVRRVLLRRFPYTVIFVELAEEIRVLAFAHGHRRPGYWRRRLA